MSSEYHQSQWGTAQIQKEAGHLLFVTSTDVHMYYISYTNLKVPTQIMAKNLAP